MWLTFEPQGKKENTRNVRYLVLLNLFGIRILNFTNSVLHILIYSVLFSVAEFVRIFQGNVAQVIIPYACYNHRHSKPGCYIPVLAFKINKYTERLKKRKFLCWVYSSMAFGLKGVIMTIVGNNSKENNRLRFIVVNMSNVYVMTCTCLRTTRTRWVNG